MGHHGGRGTTAAAMVHRVLLIDMCLVLDLCVGRVLTYHLDKWSSSIGHPPHSSASPVELRLRVGPRALSGKKKEVRVKGVLKFVRPSVRPSVRNAPKGKKLGVRK